MTVDSLAKLLQEWNGSTWDLARTVMVFFAEAIAHLCGQVKLHRCEPKDAPEGM